MELIPAALLASLSMSSLKSHCPAADSWGPVRILNQEVKYSVTLPKPQKVSLRGMNKIPCINKIVMCQSILAIQPHSYGEDKLKCTSFSFSERFMLRCIIL